NQPPRHGRQPRLSGLSRDIDHLSPDPSFVFQTPREGRERCKEEANEKAI
ncbi:unnamed protein product, partial [Ectocarpus sp. 4 AP-2014]